MSLVACRGDMLQPCKSNLPERMQEDTAPKREKVDVIINKKECFSLLEDEVVSMVNRWTDKRNDQKRKSEGGGERGIG